MFVTNQTHQDSCILTQSVAIVRLHFCAVMHLYVSSPLTSHAPNSEVGTAGGLEGGSPQARSTVTGPDARGQNPAGSLTQAIATPEDQQLGEGSAGAVPGVGSQRQGSPPAVRSTP